MIFGGEMDNILNSIVGIQPIYRVLDREENLNFFRDVLGMKVLNEENAQVFIGGHQAKLSRFQLEESPGVRAVQGLKKHARTIIKTDLSELEQLLADNLEKVSKIYQGEKGYAFEAISPENDLFLVTSEDLDHLKEIKKDDVKLSKHPDFKGLSDFEITDLELNVSDSKTMDFLCKVFCAPSKEAYLNLPVANLKFNNVSGEAHADLNAAAEKTLDLEIIAFKMNQSFDLSGFVEKNEDLEGIYLDSSHKTAAIIIPNQLEIWLMK